MKQKLLCFFTLGMLLIGSVYAQERRISGRVTSSADGTPVGGASVVVVGANRATQTDDSGNYSISASDGAVLLFSYLGYTSQRVTVSGQSILNVELISDSETLDEVIVTAYGTQTRESIAGSIATLKAADLEQVQTSNPIQSLAGKVGGVQIRSTTGQPGAAPVVRFRGLGSLSSSNEPLYVVDGVPFNGDVASISPQDIEEMSFLKDASANALYGSRGANGVIIITTKRGRGDTQITFESRGGFNSRAVADYDMITDPSQYYEARWQRIRLARIQAGLSSEEAGAYASNNLKSDLGINIFDVPNNQIVDPTTGRINPNANVVYHDNWSDYLFENSWRHEHLLNIRQGSDKVSTYFSGAYLKDDGYVVNSGFDRVSARANIEYDPYDFLKVGGNINFAGTKMRDPQAGKASGTYSNLFSWTRNMAPIYPIFARDQHGNILRNADGRELYDWGRGENMSTDGTPSGRPYIDNMNPYASTLLDLQSNRNTNLGFRNFVSIDFLKDFNFTYNLSYDFLTGNRLRYQTPEGGDANGVNGRITNAVTTQRTLTNQQLLTYDKSFGRHDVSVLLGHEVSDYKNEMLSGTKTNVVIPNNVIISNASQYSSLNGYNDLYRVEGYFSRVNYNYDAKYYLNASFRRDGSSVFHPDHRWGNFYGVGGAWIISKESFLSEANGIDNLKFKISYGEQGNDNLFYPSYVSMNHRSHFGFNRNYIPYMTQYEIGPDAEGNPSISEVYTGTENLKWEVSKNFNTGFEIAFLQNRVNIDVEYFQRKVQDMLFNLPQPPSSGIPSLSTNIGDMVNRGVELAINADVIRTEDVGLGLWVNATHYKNKITRLYKNPETGLPESFNTGVFRMVEGHSAYSYYLRKFVGVNPETGRAIWSQGETDDVTALPVGEQGTTETFTSGTLYLHEDKTAHPDVYGGFGLDFRYKRLSLNVGFAYQSGGYVFDGVYASTFREGTGMGNSGANFHKDVFNTWTPENPNASLPILSTTANQQYGNSDLFLVSASYISLENVGLSYDLSNEYFNRVGIKNSRLTLMGNNLYLWSKRKGLDPRMMQLGGATNNGVTLNNYSLLRSLSLGLTVNF